MFALKHYRDRAEGVADLLNFAALRAPGVALCKDGSLLSGWFWRGPDAASMTQLELNKLTAQVNAAFRRMGSGWTIWLDAARMPTASYPPREASHFPDPVTAMIDEERRRQFLAEGAHFETEHAFCVMYTPPLRRQQRLAGLVYDDDEAAAAVPPSERQIAYFEQALADIEDSLGDPLNLRRMGDFAVRDASGRSRLQDELVNYLQFCLTGELHGLNVPPCPMYLDHYLGGQELWPGDTPRIGDKFICCVAIEGFPAESWPLILQQLAVQPIAARFSSRFSFVDQHVAVGRLESQRRKWKQWARGFLAQVFRTQGGYVNEDALLMSRQTESALSDANSAMVAFGYYTPVVVMMGEDRETLLDQARIISRELRRDGFAGRVETINTTEAWLGSIPGHPWPNVRRPLFHTLNFADCLPLSSEWPGEPVASSPLFPADAPALMHAATTGATPFRLNLHVSDVGHTLIFGPTGAGKSTLLCMIAAQFRRYAGARITAFDKGCSMFALATAAGGRHYDLAGEHGSPGLCPLADLETDNDAAWAEDWLASCYELQTGTHPSPAQKAAIHRAIGLMRRTTRNEGRTLTDFVATVQDEDIRAALAHYTIDGPLGDLLDSRADGLDASAAFVVFELEALMALGPRSLIPVLLYLFRRFEKSLDGGPALLLLDEAWVMLGHPAFREKIREWLKVLRKANCAVVLATQSISDAEKSGILDVLWESCLTRLLLPNEEAGKSGSGQVMGPRDHYTVMGLNETEIGLIANATKKRHYYYVSPLGRRLFELGLGPIALAFCAVSSKKDVGRVCQLQAEHGDAWPWRWLEEREVPYERIAEVA